MKTPARIFPRWVVVCLLWALFTPFVGFADDGEGWPQQSRTKAWLDRLEHYAKRDMPFEFHGQVTDLDGNPVAAAEVKVTVSHSPPSPLMENRRRLVLTTDGGGRFRVASTGYRLSLEEIVKEGYVYHYRYNKTRVFRLRKGKELAELGQVEDHPVTFRVRRKGPPALVLTGFASFQLRPGPNSKWIVDLKADRWSEPEYIRYKRLNFKDWSSDLQISLSKEDDTYQLLFEGLDEGTGIVMGCLHQYVAPAGGYQPKLVLSIPETELTERRWLFVEGRGGAFYSMLQVETHPTEEWLNVRIGYGTNPTGSRNLEYSAELAEEYRKSKRQRK